MTPVPGVFKLIQGGPGWKAKYSAMESATATVTSASAVRELITTVQALDDEEKRDAFITEVSAAVMVVIG